MNHPTILCVDDERNVLLTLRTQLSRYFPHYAIEIAESAVEALELVDELMTAGNEIPLVIADQIMPGIKGDDFLIELSNRYPQILQVMLTGQASVEAVGNVVNRGSLYRFLAKPWNERDLQLTVSEAIRRYQQEQQLAQQQQALAHVNQQLNALNESLEQQVRDRTQQLQTALAFNEQVFATAQEGIIVWDCDLRYRVWNRCMETLSGLPAAAVIGQYCLDVFPFAHLNGVLNSLQQALAGATVQVADAPFHVPATGHSGWSFATFTPLRDATGQITGVLGTVYDVTDRKRAELEQQKLVKLLIDMKFALDQAAIVVTTDAQGRMIEVNDRFCEISQYSRAELVGQTHRVVNSGYHPDEFFRELWQTIRRGEVWQGEIKNRAKDGSEYWVDTVIVPFVNERGTPYQYMAIRFDITQRKQAEVALQQSQMGLAAAQRIAQLGNWEFDLATQTIAWSEGLFRIFGLDPAQGEPTDDDFWTLIHSDDRPLLNAAVEQAIATGASYSLEHRITRPDGSMLYLLGKGEAICNEQGQVIKLVGTSQNITTTKLTEIALRDSEAQNRAILSALPDIMTVINAQGNYLSFSYNQFAGELIPLENTDPTGMNVVDVLPPVMAERCLQAVQTVLQTGTMQTFEQQIWFADRIQYEEMRIVPYQTDKVLCLVRDISDRKQAEIALRANERKYHQILDSITDMVIVKEPGSRINWANKALRDYYNMELEALQGIVDASFNQPDYTKQYLRDDAFVFNTGQSLEIPEEPIIRHDGVERTFSTIKAPIRDERGQVQMLVAVCRDITEQKQVTAQIRQSQEQLAAIAANVPGGVFRFIYHADGTHSCPFVSEGYRTLLESDPALFQANPEIMLEMVHPDDRPIYTEAAAAAIAGTAQTFQGEVRYILPSGRIKWVSTIAQLYRTDNGDVVVDGIDIDITDRKQTELELQQREEQLQAIAANIPGYLSRFVVHPDGTTSIPYISAGAALIYGLPLAQLTNGIADTFKLIHPADRAMADTALATSRQTLSPCNVEFRIIDSAGQLKWLNIIAQVQRSPTGDTIFDGLCLDISDRKRLELSREQAEAALRESETRFRGIFDSAFQFIGLFTPTGEFIEVNATALTFAGSSVADIIGQPIWDSIWFRNLPNAQAALQKFIAIAAQGEFCQLELQVEGHDGTILDLDTSFKPLFDEAGRVYQILGEGRNISDRKRAEDQLRRTTEELDRFFSVSLDLLCIANLEGSFLRLNPAWESTLGYPLSELTSQQFLDFVHPDDLAATLAAISTLANHQEIPVFVNRYRHQDGSYRWLEWRSIPVGQLIYAAARDITIRKRAEAYLAAQNVLLARIASGEPLFVTLNALIQQVEQNLSGALGSVLLLDQEDRLHHGAAPNLPVSYIQAVDGVKIGEGVGSCGTAAFRKETIIVTQIATDPLWQDFQEIALSYGFQACWSIPISASDGRVLGTFGVYYTVERAPAPHELELVTQMANIAGIAIDRDCTETKIRQSEEQLRLTLEFTGIGAWNWHPITGNCTWNGKTEELLELPSGLDNLYQTWCDRMHPEDVERIDATLKAAIATQTAFTAEYRYCLQDGRWVWQWVRGQGIYTAAGELERILGVIQDITDRKQAEVALRQSEAKNRAMLAAIPDLLLRVKQDGTCLDFMPPATATGEEVMPMQSQLTEALPPVLLEQPIRLMEQAQATGELQVWEQQIERGGSLCYEEVRLVHCEADEFVIIVRDITQRKRTELALQSSEERYTLATRAAKVGVWEWQIQTNNFYLDPNIKALLGYTDAEIPNEIEQWITYIHPADREAVMAAAQDHLDGKTPEYVFEHRMIHKDGSIVWILVRGQLLRDAAGNPERLLGTDTDISDRKQSELSLQRTNQLLTAISAAQTRFITEADPDILFDNLLETLLELTSSEYGFIGEILHNSEGTVYIDDVYMKIRGQSYLKTKAITNLAWNAETRHLHDTNVAHGMEFHNLHTLFGQVMVTGKPVIANDPSTDPRRGGIPEGHPPLNAFLGVPFYRGEQMVGMVGIANRPTGYSEAVITELAPFLTTCASTIEAYRSDTLRKQAEMALQESEERYRLLTEISPVGIFRSDLEGQCIYANPKNLEITGRSLAQTLGAGWSQNLHPDDSTRLYQLWTDFVQRTRQGETDTYAVEQRFRYPDGTLKWVLAQAVPERNASGELVGFIGSVIDITDRKLSELALQQAMDALQASELKLRQITNAVPGAVYQYQLFPNGDHCFPFMSAGLLDLYGVTAEAACANSQVMWDVLPPEQIDHLAASIQHSATTLEPWNYEYPIQVGGQQRWINGRALPVPQADGSILWNGVLTDISDRKQTELALQHLNEELEHRVEERTETLRQSELRYRAIVEDQTELICRFLPDGTLTFVNTTYCRYFNQSPSELLGHSFLALMPPEEREYCQQKYAQLTVENPTITYEHQVMLSDGSIRWQQWTDRAIFDQQQQLVEYQSVGRDITDRKMAAAALQRSERDLRTVFNNVYDAIFIHDLDGRVLDVNDRALELYGISRETLITESAPDTTTTHALGENLASLVQQVKVQDVVRFEWQDRRLDNDAPFDAEVSLRQVLLGDRPVIIAGVRDISDRKQTEFALKESEERFRQLAETVDAVFWLTDLTPQILYVSPAFERVWGRTAADVFSSHTNFLDTIHPDDVAETTRQMAQRFVGEVDQEYRIFRPNGELRWIRDRAFPIYNAAGEVYRVAGVAEDITDRKQAEQALQEAQAFAQSIADRTPAALYIYDIEHQCNRYSNRSVVETLGYSTAAIQAMGAKLMSTIIHPDDGPAVLRHQEEIANAGDGEDIKLEYRMRHADGSWRWLYSLDSVFKRDAQGHVTQYIGAAQDITDRKRLEEELLAINAELEQRVAERTQDLQAAMEAAEAANRAKSTFLANMSHELRTPLNAILGFAQLLARDLTLEPQKRDQLNIINRSGNHLLNLINDILEMSKIEAGRTTFTPNGFDLYTQISTLEEMFQLRAREKGLSFTLDLDPALPQFVETDENKLRQVLINLLGNAIKFTRSGYVQLRIHPPRFETPLTQRGDRPSPCRPQRPPQLADQRANAASQLHIHFEVEDTGPGIDPIEIESLFEPFIQSSNRQISQEGTGLGLPISRQFVQLLGGELTVQSIPGSGSTFAFTIPVQQAAAPELTQSSSPQILRLAPHQPTYRILIVEDNETNRLLLLQLLQAVGFAVQAAADGQAAIDLWATWRPHLIWMDMRMPTLDGYAATRQIRALEQQLPAQPTALAAPTVIIALTASAFEEDRARVLAVGCNDFVRKPFQEKELLEKMADYLGVTYEYAEATAARSVQTVAATSSEVMAELRSLSPLVLTQLHQATIQLDQQQLEQMMAQLTPTHPQLVQLLTEKLSNFDFEQILQLLQNTTPPS